MEQDIKTVEQLDQEWKDQCMSWCRDERDRRLAETDYIHLPDVTVADEFRDAMLIYRQQLRDVPAAFSTEYDSMTEDQKGGITPQSFEWPVKPEKTS